MEALEGDSTLRGLPGAATEEQSRVRNLAIQRHSNLAAGLESAGNSSLVSFLAEMITPFMSTTHDRESPIKIKRGVNASS